MIEGLLILLLCQLAGTLVADTLHLPIPGAVLGMLLLLGLLAWRRWPAACTELGLSAILRTLVVTGAGVLCSAMIGPDVMDGLQMSGDERMGGPRGTAGGERALEHRARARERGLARGR